MSEELEQRQNERSENDDTFAASSVGSNPLGPCFSDSESDDDDDVRSDASGQKHHQQLQVEVVQPGSGSLDRNLSALDLKSAAFE